MANSVDPDQTAVCTGSMLFASILNLSVMLGNYLQQTTSADNIFRCIFFLGPLRVRVSNCLDPIRTDVLQLLGLIWVHTVCKVFKYRAKVVTGMFRVYRYFIKPNKAV